MTTAQEGPITTEIDTLRQALAKHKRKRARRILRGMHPAKVASLLESLTPEQRIAAWQQIEEQAEQKVLAYLPDGLHQQMTRDVGADEHPDAAPPETPDSETPLQAAYDEPETQLRLVLDALEQGKLKRIARLFRELHPARIAGLLESLPAAERAAAWDMMARSLRPVARR